MKSLVKVKLKNGKCELVNEDQICRISQQENEVLLHLSSGEVLAILEPPYDQWENDLYVRH